MALAGRIRASAAAFGTVVVAGPQVVAPDREVDALVGSVDLFQLFGEMAGVDVRAVVPREHMLDSRPTLGYLTDPGGPATRALSFTQLGNGLKASTTTLYACVLAVGPSNVCTDILFTSKDLCVAELGTWYGPTAPAPENPNPPDPAYKVKAAQPPRKRIDADLQYDGEPRSARASRRAGRDSAWPTEPPCPTDLSRT